MPPTETLSHTAASPGELGHHAWDDDEPVTPLPGNPKPGEPYPRPAPSDAFYEPPVHLPDPLQWAERNLWHEQPPRSARRTAPAGQEPSPFWWEGETDHSDMFQVYDLVGAVPLPGQPVVYVLYGIDGFIEPVYLGSTSNLRTRLRSHMKKGKVFIKWRARLCENRRDAYLVERILLQEPVLLPLNVSRS